MKPLILIIFSFLGIISSAKADTISYSHIYYNETKIKELSEFSQSEIILKEADVRVEDSLGIKHYSCAVCHHCETFITIENGTNYFIKSEKNVDDRGLIRISVYDLLKYHRINKNEYYDVWFYKITSNSQARRWRIFKIKIE
jgi:hypothetical protein